MPLTPEQIEEHRQADEETARWRDNYEGLMADATYEDAIVENREALELEVQDDIDQWEADHTPAGDVAEL